jgi:uncharacterized protein YjiS (DUF1127 family)
MSICALPAAGAARRHGGPQRFASVAVTRLMRWHELARQRRALLMLDERILKDIGVTRAEAEREASRPFWSDALDP